MRMTVERSIPNRSAASPWLSSPVTSCNHSSYFWLGLRNRLARRPSRSRPESCWVISTLLLGAGGPYRMRCNQNPDVGHEVRRKTSARAAPSSSPPSSSAPPSKPNATTPNAKASSAARRSSTDCYSDSTRQPLDTITRISTTTDACTPPSAWSPLPSARPPTMLHPNRSRSPYEDGTKPMTVQRPGVLYTSGVVASVLRRPSSARSAPPIPISPDLAMAPDQPNLRTLNQ